MAPESPRSGADGEVQSEGIDALSLGILEDRFQRVLADNAKLTKELEAANKELRVLREDEEELTMTWKASVAVASRQKTTAHGLARNAQVDARARTAGLVDAARHAQELQDVHRRLKSVNRQLSFAQELQEKQLGVVEQKIATRSSRARRIEQAIYRLVVEAQSESDLDEALSAAVARGGPLLRSVLAREAQREALELTAQEEAAHGGGAADDA
mmetsp:Transcript_106761/g.298853  ORF Transcript_106761/g.298853 Transcript_106761/m.298853 type:complete len:214 (-) Transcript_106761:43-684(-)